MRYQIWTEGFAATGEQSGAIHHGSAEGETFKEAVENFMKENDWDIKGYYNPERLTYWACRFFDNETDARKSFG